MTSSGDLAHPFSDRRTGLSRRRVLQVTALGSVGAGLAAAGCGRPDTGPTPGGTTPTTDETGTATLTMPSYRPLDVVSPDLLSDDPEVPVGFLQYPPNPPTVTDGQPPVAGAVPITSMVEASGPIPPPAPGNSYWAELNARLGADLEMSITPGAEYLAKLQTVVAGSQLPELVQIKLGVPKLGALLDAEFLDLGPVVNGDAILKYPYLAAIPTYAWEACIVGGKLRGVPFSQPRVSNGFTARLDIVNELGLDMELRDGDDFISWCRELTDSKANRWALQSPLNILGNVVAPMMGAPNVWRVDGDRFISQFETDEYVQALETVTAMIAEGLFHPESISSPKPTWLAAGNVVTEQNGLTAWTRTKADSGKEDLELQLVRMPKWSGGGLASVRQGRGIYTWASLRQTDDAERVDQLLKVINWLAAPFGSQEQLFRSYGIEGKHYDLDGSDPIATNADEVRLPSAYLGRCAPFIYFPGAPEMTEDQFAYHAEVKHLSEPLPTVGLTSETELSKAAAIGRDLNDAIVETLLGRRTLAQWPEAVDRWKKGGGDEIANEYAEARQQQGS